jgi:hypothetical protein
MPSATEGRSAKPGWERLLSVNIACEAADWNMALVSGAERFGDPEHNSFVIFLAGIIFLPTFFEKSFCKRSGKIRTYENMQPMTQFAFEKSKLI